MLSRFGKNLLGVLSGFDRLIFRGYLKSLYHESGILAFLCANRVLLKDFAGYAEKTTQLLKNASCALARRDGAFPTDYYWTAHQTEWTTDVMFRDAQRLAEVFPALMEHAMIRFDSADVMRFLGGKVHGRFLGEIVTDFKRRPGGVRIKHRVERNWVKMYNKAGSVLRVETTINDPSRFKVFRRKQGAAGGSPEWYPLRKGVADLQRRVEISQACNERYLEALAPVNLSSPLAKLVGEICRPTRWNGKRVRALRPWSEPDMEILHFVGREEFLLHGVRNRDLRAHLFPGDPASVRERRKRTARVSRLLRMLRAHGIIRKIQRTHRYQLTERGGAIVKALARAQNLTLEQWEKIPA